MVNIDLLDLFNKGGLLIWPILFCSVLGTTIFFERFALYRRVLKRDRDNEAIFQLVYARNVTTALTLLEQAPNPYAIDKRLLREVLQLERPDRETVEMVLEHAVEKEVSTLAGRLNTLAILASVAPLLGLLGTVIGMIKAFFVVENMGGSVNAAVLAGGIWEAMLTTAFGLVAAIPLLFFHNHLETKLHVIQEELEEVSIAFMKVWAKTHTHGA